MSLINSGPVQAVLGDISKWVPMSSDRFVDLVVKETSVVATLGGAAEEIVTVYFLINDTIKQADCSLSTPECLLFVDNEQKQGKIKILGVRLSQLKFNIVCQNNNWKTNAN